MIITTEKLDEIEQRLAVVKPPIIPGLVTYEEAVAFNAILPEATELVRLARIGLAAEAKPAAPEIPERFMPGEVIAYRKVTP